jgi:hypothetical protein
MQAGTSNRTAIRIVPETVFGTTPATPAFQNMRYTGESIVYTPRNIVSNEIRSDRATADLIQVGAGVQGDLNVELSFATFDALIEAAMCSTFSAPVAGASSIKNGTALSSFTIQKHFQDLATPLFQNFKGCRVGGMKLDFKTGSILTGSFSFMGCSAVIGNSQIAGATFTSPGATADVFNAVSNLIGIESNDVAFASKIRSMSLELNNNLRGQEAIGTLGYVGIALGKLDVMGNVELYFEDSTEYTKFLSATSFKFEFIMQNAAGDNYKVTLPKVKYEEGQITSGGLDEDLIVQGKWRALYDTTSACMIQIDRYDAP